VQKSGRHSSGSMKLQRGQPKRLHARFPFAIQLNASQLSPPGEPSVHGGVLQGKVENISAGGVCIRTKKALKTSGLVRCELQLPGIPVRVPILGQVRWIEKRSGVNPYRVGLQYII